MNGYRPQGYRNRLIAERLLFFRFRHYHGIVIIAGAGIIGLSCAWRLAQRGLRVTVFDAGQAAREASWAGAGMLAPGGEILAESAFTEMALRSLRQFPDFVGELEEETKRSIDYRRSGAVEVALTDDEAETLTGRAARQEELGIHSEVCRHNGWPARFYPDDAVVDPRDVTRALLIACRARGVVIHECEPVVQVSTSGHAVHTTSDEYRDSGAVIAAGAWSSDLFPRLPRTSPVRGHLIGYRVAPGLLDPILRHGHTYLLQRRSGLLVAGSSTEHVGFDRSIDAGITEDIHRRAAGLLPALGPLQASERWNGFRPGIDAAGPAIGRIAGTSVWTAFGHYRNGILLAPETARAIAESVAAEG
jgi:glycine oxidase